MIIEKYYNNNIFLQIIKFIKIDFYYYLYIKNKEKEIEAIEFRLLRNKICRTIKDINKVLEYQLKDDKKI